MYPFIEPISWVMIYLFWLTITICFFLFVWMLKKLSTKFWYDFLIFKKNILWYFIWVFFFSRLFYVISRWNDLKHIDNPIEFFIMNDYNFSLMWALFWFLVVFHILIRIREEKLDNFINWLVLSFLFILPIWYIWALLWWQVYWKETFFWIELMYNHPFTPVPYKVAIFPLPIVYSIVFFILFSTMYILSMYIKQKAILWYIWLMLFSCILFIMEFFSWKYWIFRDFIGINLTQVSAIILLIFSAYRLHKIYKQEQNDKKIMENYE